ncbi:MAG: hypothetical protein A3J29_06285 [Acidobacteria bacterium RIFCSPLOWO2_12_FULL_67_14b]|nr:MAG: hypothetical protein A3J29_06285 [Acidobacteria bacterium RIFCSPLOWO2_12_FULL_67_14b]
MLASVPFAAMFSQLSKGALIDTLWCASQLGTNETAAEIASQAARNAAIALGLRGDGVPADVQAQSEQRIDSDGFFIPLRPPVRVVTERRAG